MNDFHYAHNTTGGLFCVHLGVGCGGETRTAGCTRPDCEADATEDNQFAVRLATPNEES